MDTQEKELYNSILITAAVLAAILIYFIASIIKQQRRYRTLANQKINAEITTLENERRRIASDLHDEIGPLLSAVKLQINHLEGGGEKELALIQKSNAYIDDIISKMREISNNLLPNLLVRKGLVPSIQDFIDKISNTAPLQISFIHNQPMRLAPTIEVNVYRIVQEIVHNCIKHSGAEHLQISLYISSTELLLKAEDNGVGFDYEKIRNVNGGLGLLTLQSRTDVMGGEFNCESKIGKGTKYLFEIPFLL